MPTAIQVKQYGGPEVLQRVEVDLMPLQPHQVRFQVMTAIVNPIDVEIRSGRRPLISEGQFPYTPGVEALGEVIEVGSAVFDMKVGDRVLAMMQGMGGIQGTHTGGYQEIVTAAASTLAVIPKELNPFTVAAIGLYAVTAFVSLQRIQLQAGQTIVVNTGYGGVGSVAAAIAKAMGAKVIVTSFHPERDSYLKQAKLESIVNLHQGSLFQVIEPRSVDAVLDAAGEWTFYEGVAALKQDGRLCLIGTATGNTLHLSGWDLLRGIHLTGYSVENLKSSELRAAMEKICHWLATRQIPTVFSCKYALSEADDVHRLLESGKLSGRILLLP
jgi:NADPH2:quinone reductase